MNYNLSVLQSDEAYDIVKKPSQPAEKKKKDSERKKE